MNRVMTLWYSLCANMRILYSGCRIYAILMQIPFLGTDESDSSFISTNKDVILRINKRKCSRIQHKDTNKTTNE